MDSTLTPLAEPVDRIGSLPRARIEGMPRLPLRVALVLCLSKSMAIAMTPQMPCAARYAAFDIAETAARALGLTDAQFAGYILLVANGS